ncbi:MAG: hypothetical protein ACLQK4_01155 [Acidimicrobiales bacterium]|jgi:hypothetical protein
MKRVFTALAAGSLTLGLALSASLVGTAGAGASLKPHTFAGAITVTKPADQSITLGDHVMVKGTGWTYHDDVVVTVCNSDAVMPDPAAQLGDEILASDACAPVSLATGAGGNLSVVSKTGTFSWTGTIDAGQLGTNALSTCPQSAVDAQEGIACIVGVAEISGLTPDGNVAFAALYWSPPALTASDSYVGEAVSGTASTAEYSVTLSDAGHGVSGDPPLTVSGTVPNTGGFATSGIICTTGSVFTDNCVPDFTSPGVPASCQAASASGATAWSGETLCSYGAAVGEPIEVEEYNYLPPTSEPTDMSPLPLDTPFNCTTTGCSISANAGYGATDPGGFSSALEVNDGGTLVPLALTPGHYYFEAIGASSLDTAKGNIALLPGPAGSTEGG